MGSKRASKVSVQLREGESPLVRLKLPLALWGSPPPPLFAGCTLGGSPQDLVLDLGTSLAVGPALRLTYRPIQPVSSSLASQAEAEPGAEGGGPGRACAGLTAELRAGLGRWGSAAGTALSLRLQVDLRSPANCRFLFKFEPRVGDMSIHRFARSYAMKPRHPAPAQLAAADLAPAAPRPLQPLAPRQQAVPVAILSTSSSSTTITTATSAAAPDQAELSAAPCQPQTLVPAGAARPESSSTEAVAVAGGSTQAQGVPGLSWHKSKSMENCLSPGTVTADVAVSSSPSSSLAPPHPRAGSIGQALPQDSLSAAAAAAAPGRSSLEVSSARDSCDPCGLQGAHPLWSWAQQVRRQQGWDLAVRSSMPLGPLAVATARWRLRLPGEVVHGPAADWGAGGGSMGLTAQGLPCLLLDKISLQLYDTGPEARGAFGPPAPPTPQPASFRPTMDPPKELMAPSSYAQPFSLSLGEAPPAEPPTLPCKAGPLGAKLAGEAAGQSGGEGATGRACEGGQMEKAEKGGWRFWGRSKGSKDNKDTKVGDGLGTQGTNSGLMQGGAKESPAGGFQVGDPVGDGGLLGLKSEPWEFGSSSADPLGSSPRSSTGSKAGKPSSSKSRIEAKSDHGPEKVPDVSEELRLAILEARGLHGGRSQPI